MQEFIFFQLIVKVQLVEFKQLFQLRKFFEFVLQELIFFLFQPLELFF